MRSRLGMLLFVVLLFSVSAQAQSSPLVGTWKLNVAKSKYSPGPPAKSGATTITAVPDGIRLVNDGVNAQSQATHLEYTAKLDGKDNLQKSTIDGKLDPNAADTIAWKKIDDYTYESTTKRKGQVLTTTHYTITKDGKTRTNSVTGKNAQGQAVNNTQVYEKQ